MRAPRRRARPAGRKIVETNGSRARRAEAAPRRGQAFAPWIEREYDTRPDEGYRLSELPGLDRRQHLPSPGRRRYPVRRHERQARATILQLPVGAHCRLGPVGAGKRARLHGAVPCAQRRDSRGRSAGVYWLAMTSIPDAHALSVWLRSRIPRRVLRNAFSIAFALKSW